MPEQAPTGSPSSWPPELFVGVDAGGSHTETVAIDRTGSVRDRRTGPAAGVMLETMKGAAERIAGTVTGLLRGLPATTPVAALCVGAAGAGRPAERESLERELARRALASRLRVTTDGEIALESAFPGGEDGIVLIAGTGSVAFARGAGGALRRTGGLGWQLGDEGGGYALGRAALGLAGRTLDGRARAAGVTDAIRTATRSPDLDTLVQWAKQASRSDVAALGAAVCDAARSGDAAARELVESTAGDLVALVVALLQRLDRPAGRIALSGGLLAPGSPVRDAVVTGLGRAAPNLRLSDAAVDPALGAARLAARL